MFERFAPFLRMYSYYATAQENAASGLARCVAKYKEVAALMETSRSHPDCKGQDVQSLLIEPIQRVPRYELLLKSLLDYTERTHPDYETLDKAYQVCDCPTSCTPTHSCADVPPAASLVARRS